MSLKIGCVLCGKELQEPGGLLFASPTDVGTCAKYHICVKCEKEKLVPFMLKTMLRRCRVRKLRRKGCYESSGSKRKL